MLVVFGGLPGSGKTSLARQLSRRLVATYLRIDTIEQALRQLKGDVGIGGYLVGYALAEDNLRAGGKVIADSVNPLDETREAWRQVAERTGARMLEIEIVCSDPIEHRRRIESRTSDIPGLRLPTWSDVLEREYQDWTRPHLVIDTAGKSIATSLAEIEAGLAIG